MSWRDFILKQNPDLVKPRKPDQRFYPYCQHMKKRYSTLPPTSSLSSLDEEHPPSSFVHDDLPAPSAEKHAQDLEDAFDFIEKIMHPEATRRLTPRGALYHPFLAETAETATINGYEQPMEDDELVPHPFGEGVCGTLHQMDEADDMFVILPMPDGEKLVRKVDAGEAVAIGREPCELHREWYYECLGKGLVP
jgi:cell division control protein 7